MLSTLHPIPAGTNYFSFWLAYLHPTVKVVEEFNTVAGTNLVPNHLWFLMYIFTYSIVAWALYHLTGLLGFRLRIMNIVNALPCILAIVLIPIFLNALYGQFLYPLFPQPNAFLGDFYNHARSFTAFCIGIILVNNLQFWAAIKRWRWTALVTAICTYAVTLHLFHGGSLIENSSENGLVKSLESLVWQINAWVWILAVIGWSQQLLNKGNAVLSYLNKGVYCYYILHQTIIIVCAYTLGRFEFGPVIEPLVIIVLSFGGCLLGYELLKRIPGKASLWY
ncbi:MAG: glucan biosynthesis protein C [Flavobacteriales bacterium]|jgi:glucan biosynthesis protein C